MAPRYVLILNGVVQNVIKADQAFIDSLSNQYDSIVNAEAVESVVGVGYTRNEDGTFSPPLKTAEEIEAVGVAEVRVRMEYGAQVIEKFRARTVNVPDEQALEILGAVGAVLQLLQLGILKQAATVLDSITDVALFDEPYDAARPELGSLKDYFVSYIHAGDV